MAGGCSCFQPLEEDVTITTATPGALISVDGTPVGISPTTVKLDRNKSYAVTAFAGGVSGTGVIERRVSGTGVLDIVGGALFLVPFVGCFTPGFWTVPSDVKVDMKSPSVTGTTDWRY